MEVVAVLLYFIIGIVSAGLLMRATLLDDGDLAIWIVVVAWPLVLVCALVFLVFYYVDLAVRYIGGK